MKADPKFNGRYVEGAGGTKLFVEEIGDPSRPSIIWIHGFCQCRLCWDKQFESDLASQFHLVRLDLRGHGLSDRLSDPAAFQDGKTWADDLHAVITALDLHRPVLAGWSYGGFILCDYVRHYGQENLGGIIFVAAATAGRNEARQLFGADFLSLVPGFLSQDYAEGIIALERFMGMLTYEELDSQTLYFFLGFNASTLPASRQGMLTRQHQNASVMESFTVPVLITQGKEDRCVLPAAADFISSHVAQAKRIDYDRCGHAPFVEVTDQFNRDVAAFMETMKG